MRASWENKSHWPNLCDRIRSFNTFISRAVNFASMRWSSFSNNWWGRHNSLCWQCISYYKHLWYWWNVHMGRVIIIGRPDVTEEGLAAHDVLHISLLPPGKRLSNSYLSNNSIGFDNSHCIWNLIAYRGATFKSTSLQGWFWSQSMIPIPASPMMRISDHWAGSRGDCKSFEMSLSKCQIIC